MRDKQKIDKPSANGSKSALGRGSLSRNVRNSPYDSQGSSFKNQKIIGEFHKNPRHVIRVSKYLDKSTQFVDIRLLRFPGHRGTRHGFRLRGDLVQHLVALLQSAL